MTSWQQWKLGVANSSDRHSSIHLSSLTWRATRKKDWIISSVTECWKTTSSLKKQTLECRVSVQISAKQLQTCKNQQLVAAESLHLLQCCGCCYQATQHISAHLQGAFTLPHLLCRLDAMFASRNRVFLREFISTSLVCFVSCVYMSPLSLLTSLFVEGNQQAAVQIPEVSKTCRSSSWTERLKSLF